MKQIILPPNTGQRSNEMEIIPFRVDQLEVGDTILVEKTSWSSPDWDSPANRLMIANVNVPTPGFNLLKVEKLTVMGDDCEIETNSVTFTTSVGNQVLVLWNDFRKDERLGVKR